MTVATVTNKEAIVIPKEIRDYLKLDTGTKIEFVIDQDGGVKMIPLKFGVGD
jgi:AbrB family looped-hinge helix DNA binding protein